MAQCTLNSKTTHTTISSTCSGRTLNQITKDNVHDFFCFATEHQNSKLFSKVRYAFGNYQDLEWCHFSTLARPKPEGYQPIPGTNFSYDTSLVFDLLGDDFGGHINDDLKEDGILESFTSWSSEKAPVSLVTSAEGLTHGITSLSLSAPPKIFSEASPTSADEKRIKQAESALNNKRVKGRTIQEIFAYLELEVVSLSEGDFRKLKQLINEYGNWSEGGDRAKDEGVDGETKVSPKLSNVYDKFILLHEFIIKNRNEAARQIHTKDEFDSMNECILWTYLLNVLISSAKSGRCNEDIKTELLGIINIIFVAS